MVSKVITIYGQPYDFQGQPYGSRSTMGPNAPIPLEIYIGLSVHTGGSC